MLRLTQRLRFFLPVWAFSCSTTNWPCSVTVFSNSKIFLTKPVRTPKCPYLWLTGGSEPWLVFRSGHTAKAEAQGGWSQRLCRWRRTGAAVRLTAGPPLLTAASPPTRSPCCSRLAQANVLRGTFRCHQAQPPSDSGADAAKEPGRLGLSENTRRIQTSLSDLSLVLCRTIQRVGALCHRTGYREQHTPRHLDHCPWRPEQS